jgi:hypothetical protein
MRPRLGNSAADYISLWDEIAVQLQDISRARWVYRDGLTRPT